MGKDEKQMNITSQQGFTLVELIVVIVILAVVSAIALPSFQNTIISNRMTTEINTLVMDLHFAKTEAIKRSRDITLCVADDDALECRDSSDDAAGNWGANGWLVMDEDQVIRVADAISDSDVLTEVGVSESGVAGRVIFNRYGFTTGSARSFMLCGPFGDNGVIKGAVITTSGRIRNAADISPENGNGIVEYIDFSGDDTDERNLTSVDMGCS